MQAMRFFRDEAYTFVASQFEADFCYRLCTSILFVLFGVINPSDSLNFDQIYKNKLVGRNLNYWGGWALISSELNLRALGKRFQDRITAFFYLKFDSFIFTSQVSHKDQMYFYSIQFIYFSPQTSQNKVTT
jgi:hypothetical protein